MRITVKFTYRSCGGNSGTPFLGRTGRGGGRRPLPDERRAQGVVRRRRVEEGLPHVREFLCPVAFERPYRLVVCAALPLGRDAAVQAGIGGKIGRHPGDPAGESIRRTVLDPVGQPHAPRSRRTYR